jgi:hypothetical protein
MTDYPNSHKTILVICDGIIKGSDKDYEPKGSRMAAIQVEAEERQPRG